MVKKNKETTLDTIIRVLQEDWGIEDSNKITKETRFSDDLELDSLDMVESIMALEEEFKIEISDEVLENVKTVGDLIKIIDELLE